MITFKDRFTAICEEIAQFGLKEHQRRQEEIKSFFSCIEEAVSLNKQACVQCIENFENYKRKVHK